MAMQSRRIGRLVAAAVVLAVVIGGGAFALGIWGGVELMQAAREKGCTDPFADTIPLPELAPATGKRVRFLVIGDTGTGSTAQDRVARAARTVCDERGCDFALLLGDNFYPDGVSGVDDPLFRERYEKQYGPLGRPVLAVLGNHDVHNNPAPQVLYSLRSDTWRMPAYAYRFRAGPVRFFAVNTNCSLLQWHRLADRLERESSSAAWTVTFGHHPIFSTGPHGDADAITRWYFGRYIAPHVDAYFAGHTHMLEHLRRPDSRTAHLISGAGGGSNVVGPDYEPRPSAAETPFLYGEPGFAWVEADAETFTVRFFDDQPQELYRHTVRRSDRTR